MDDVPSVIEPDIQFMMDMRQNILDKRLDKKAVERALEFMKEWNRNRPAAEG